MTREPRSNECPRPAGKQPGAGRLLPDGGHEPNEEASEDGSNSDPATDDGEDGSAGPERSNVEVMDPGEAAPVDPKWEKPDPADIPEVEGPKTRPADPGGSDEAGGPHHGNMSGAQSTGGAGAGSHRGPADEPTAGMPNRARSPGQTRLQEGGSDGFIVALELCASLPDDVRLPDEATDLVPVALEAELEQTVQQFAGQQFDNPSPHVETLDFVEVEDEIWFRLRLGIPPESFADLDPDTIRDHALQKLEGML